MLDQVKRNKRANKGVARSRQSFTIYAVSVPGEEQKEKEEKEEKEEKPGRSTPQSTRNPRPRPSICTRLSNKLIQELE